VSYWLYMGDEPAPQDEWRSWDEVRTIDELAFRVGQQLRAEEEGDLLHICVRTQGPTDAQELEERVRSLEVELDDVQHDISDLRSELDNSDD
jgi:hypothetical protein